MSLQAATGSITSMSEDAVGSGNICVPNTISHKSLVRNRGVCINSLASIKKAIDSGLPGATVIRLVNTGSVRMFNDEGLGMTTCGSTSSKDAQVGSTVNLRSKETRFC